MKARLVFITSLVLLLLIAGCGEDSDQLLRGEFPYAAITSPADWSEVFGIVKITVDAMDNSAVSVVELFIDGEGVEVLSTSPYEYDWDTTRLDDGSMHTIYAKAVDDEGYTMGTHAIRVTVRNAGITRSTYTNWKYGFQISAPSPEWTVHSEASLEIEFPALVAISSGLFGVSTAIVAVGVEVFTGGLSRYEPLMEDQFRDIQIGRTKDAEINDIPAKEMLIRQEPFFGIGPTFRGKVIYFTKGEVIYLIIAFVHEHAYPLYEKDIDEVIDTFEFL